MPAAVFPRWVEGRMPVVRQEDEGLFLLYPPSKPRPHGMKFERTFIVLKLLKPGFSKEPQNSWLPN